MYRSQLLLQQLGISQWIPRVEQTVQQPEGLLWRDQEDVLPLSVVPENLHVQAHRTEKETHHSASNALSALKQQVSKDALDVSNEIAVAPTSMVDQKVILEDVQDYPQTIAFDCHLLIHEKFILSAQIETEDQQRLFNQIAKACYAEPSFVQWPLAIDTWQMNDYVLQSYLKGVFASHQDKVFIHLGDVPFPIAEMTFIQQKSCASLQQLLESAQHKRALWQQLYPLVYNDESNNA